MPGSGLVGDYEPLSVFIVFPVGTTELSMCVNITVNQDNSLEPVPEMFTVLATAGNGDTVPTSPQTVLILSNDSECSHTSFPSRPSNFTFPFLGIFINFTFYCSYSMHIIMLT